MYSYELLRRNIGVIQGVFTPRRVFMLATKNETNVVLVVDTSTDMLAKMVARLTRRDTAAADKGAGAADGGFDGRCWRQRDHLCRRQANVELVGSVQKRLTLLA